MRDMSHKVTEVDPEARRGTCAVCGLVRLKFLGKKSGWRCWTKHLQINTPEVERLRARRNRDLRRPPYHRYKGLVCGWCGFVPEHPCQLDVDHIDTDHSNNDPTNLQTLCANCHRLKTYRERQ